MVAISKLIVYSFCLLAFLQSTFAQDSLLIQLSKSNVELMSYNTKNFEGAGWKFLEEKVMSSTNVLIGEDHLTNEIPAFIKGIIQMDRFDNFIMEVDPYSTEIIEKSLLEYSDTERLAFNEQFMKLFSFYSLKSEYEILKLLTKSKTNLLGSDQILMYADRLIFHDLLKSTKNDRARVIYELIIANSKAHLDQFFDNPQNPMYFMTEDFMSKLNDLLKLELDNQEKTIINRMKMSVDIYQKGDHQKRIQLIKNQLLDQSSTWFKSKNLFKYGAVHMAKGESFLTIFDVGNLVANVSDANFQNSYHIMIIGESGMRGAPFEFFPPTSIDVNNGLLKSFVHFFDITQGDDWHVFNLVPLRKALEDDRLKLADINLIRLIKGYDSLVIIPEVTPAKH